MKAFSYLRVSGKGQALGDGFLRQRDTIEKYAKANGIAIEEEFRDEGISGTTELADRNGLARLIDRIESNGVRTVLVERADRVARDLLVGEVIFGQFRDLGVTVIEAALRQRAYRRRCRPYKLVERNHAHEAYPYQSDSYHGRISLMFSVLRYSAICTDSRICLNCACFGAILLAEEIPVLPVLLTVANGEVCPAGVPDESSTRENLGHGDRRSPFAGPTS